MKKFFIGFVGVICTTSLLTQLTFITVNAETSVSQSTTSGVTSESQEPISSSSVNSSVDLGSSSDTKVEETTSDSSTGSDQDSSEAVNQTTNSSAEVTPEEKTAETTEEKAASAGESWQYDSKYPQSRSDLYSAGLQGRAAEVRQVSATDTDIPGLDFVDVSSHNKEISVADYKAMKKYGIKGVVVKLTESTTYRNPYAEGQVKNALAAGLVVSVYHYSWFNTTAKAQAEAVYFAQFATELGLSKNTLMVNDIEEPKIQGTADHTSTSLAFEKKLKELGYYNVNHYIGLSWLKYGYIDASKLGANKIWVAQYPYQPTNNLLNTEYGAWQWSYTLSFPEISGKNFDISVDYNKTFTSAFVPQGPWISDNRYATITSGNYDMWENFNWTKRSSSNVYLGQTVKINGRYEHANGATYYSLYDKEGNWLGYLNASAVTVTENPQGAWQKEDLYVTITTKTNQIGSGFDSKGIVGNRGNVKDLMGKTYHATGKYSHCNGQVYYSLYDNSNNWLGYVAAGAVSAGTGAQGAWQNQSGYATVTKADGNTWTSFNFSNQLLAANQTLGKTFKISGKYAHFNGQTYYSLYTEGNEWRGYIDSAAVTLTNNAQGIWQSYSQYITITKENYNLWSSFGFTNKLGNTTAMKTKTYKANGKYVHANGATYYSVYDSAGAWLGYLNAEACQSADGAGGAWQKESLYVTVTAKTGQVGGSFDQTGLVGDRYEVEELTGKTYYATGKYGHFNGILYYSIYDNSNNWLGYIAAKQVAAASGAQGVWQAYDKKTTIIKENYNLWSSFSFTNKLGSTNERKGQTYRVNGKYVHLNGATYYSLYDEANNWLGYLNAEACQDKEN